MDEWTAGQMDEWTNGRMDEWTNGRMNKWTNGQMDEWTNGRPERSLRPDGHCGLDPQSFPSPKLSPPSAGHFNYTSVALKS
jgi:hypothetical protein